MGEPDPLIDTLAIIGTGLIGGSLGMSCLKKGLAREVVGYDSDAASLALALEKGALSKAAGSADEAVRGASMVVIAVPVGMIPEVFEQIASHMAPGTIVTDVGSTKAGLVDQISRICPDGVHFVGGHPVAGSESAGIDAADADLYEGSYWILTPIAGTDSAAYRTLMKFLTGLEVKVLSLEPQRHDEALALSSHLPQLLSSALMNFVADVVSSKEGLPLLAAGGFYDMTRIAASPSDLWVDIVQDNLPAVISVVGHFLDQLHGLEKSLRDHDWEGLRLVLNRARQARLGLSVKPGIEAAELVEIRVPIPDRAGVLAELTTMVGEAGINIEDIDIIHLPEGGRGVVHLAVTGKDSARAACEAMALKGFRPEMD